MISYLVLLSVFIVLTQLYKEDKPLQVTIDVLSSIAGILVLYFMTSQLYYFAKKRKLQLEKT